MSRAKVLATAASLAVAAGAVAAGALAAPTAAAGDETVVQATVFTGSPGPAQSRPASLSRLDSCPAYDGPAALTLAPTEQTYPVPTGSTWTLATVLGCGLQIPISQVSDVQVARPNGYEHALSAADLTDPSRYADPAAPGALPVVSNDGGEDQNTYTRPWRGGSDANAADQVIDDGPVSIVVFLDGSPLVVHATQHVLARGTQSETVRLGATVTRADHSAVDLPGLTWSWTLPDGSTTAESTPSYAFPDGSSPVSLVVSDAATGTGGTATFTVSYRAAAAATPHPGAGTATRGASAGTPPSRPTTTAATTSPRPSSAARPGPSSRTATTGRTPRSTTATAPGTAPPTTSPSPPPRPPTTPSTRAPRTHGTARPTARQHRAPRVREVPSNTRLVSGRLIADVTPRAVASSPLTRPVAATTAGASRARRGTVSGPSLDGVLVGIGALALLGCGAVRERRGRGR